ncbi:hypothetical protein M595_0588 [Lyngbya aestuarii BL J]|uniref:Uncharacterized protein n=1 Tax=Lyngbya aestuarii BL J TaxID=1348334 RepID=U7QQD7_9CYAN|nr:hypothetical protein M595_0588 [Lyngbya aestuarii BL J]
MKLGYTIKPSYIAPYSYKTQLNRVISPIFSSLKSRFSQ